MEPLTQVDKAKGEANHVWPQLLPGGKAVIFTVLRAVAGLREIAVLDLASKSVTTLQRGTYARYAPTGHLIYVKDDGALLALPFDAASLKVTGPPVALIEGIAIRTFGIVDVAFSQTGTLIYSAGGSGLEHLSWVARDGKATDIEPDWTADFVTHALSPDGKRIAVSILKEGPRDLWIKELDQGPLTRFTFDGSLNHRPEWTRDGRSLTFISDRSGVAALYGQRADGGGTAELLIGPRQESREIAEGFWSPDGKWLIYRTATADAGSGDIMGFRPGMDSAPVPLVATRFAELTPTLSSDGRWLAYAANEATQVEVYVRPFPNVGDGRWQVSTGGGSEPVWAHRGRELFYKSPDGQVMVATVTAGASFEVRSRKMLFSAVTTTTISSTPDTT
jgi:serine/threonine-protein kinase